MPKPTHAVDVADVSRVIEMGTPFDAIKTRFGLDEAAVIAMMRQQLKPSYTIQQPQMNSVTDFT